MIRIARDMKKVLTLIMALTVVVVMSNCDNDEVFDPEEQLTVDLRLIDEYLATNNLVAQIDPDSQIRYVVTQQGSGDNAEFGNSVEVDYRGFLLDDTEFDSSEGRGPLPFVLGRGDVIQGWDVAFQLLNKGTSALICIPSELAYGNSRGPGQNLPLNSVLLFEVTVIDIR